MGTGETGTVPAAVLYALLFASAVLSGVGDIFIFKWAKSPGFDTFQGRSP